MASKEAPPNTSDIIQRIREGDIRAFAQLHQALRTKYPDSAKSSGELTIYAVQELMSTDIKVNLSDIKALQLYNHYIFDDEEHSGYFLQDYSTQEGAKILLDASVAASVLKNHTNNQTFTQPKQTSEEINKYAAEIKHIHGITPQDTIQHHPRHNQLILEHLNSFEALQDLKMEVQAYKDFIHTEGESNNADSHTRVNFIENIIALHSFPKAPEKAQIQQDINDFMKKQILTNSKERGLWRTICDAIQFILNPTAYRHKTVDQIIETFHQYKENYQSIKSQNAPSVHQEQNDDLSVTHSNQNKQR